jgi:hypothetical protein
MGRVMDRQTGHDWGAYSNFQLRRVLERLREGLYDPLALRLLTARREDLDARLQWDFRELAAGARVHLCVSGTYGQGKSHTLAYLYESVLAQGYAVSAVNLDPREVPLHRFSQVYRALLQGLTLPAEPAGAAAQGSFIDIWQAWAREQTRASGDPAMAVARLLPASMPHVFKAILVALTQSTQEVSARQLALAFDRGFQPGDVPWTLRRALLGEPVPVVRLRAALKSRQVWFYREGSLSLREHETFLQMVLALPQLLRRMGYRGWTLLFDEGEAIAQLPRPARARGYRILHQLLFPPSRHPGLYPVFAFTPDFFQRLREEDYQQPDFDRDYARAWRQLSVYQLHGLSREAWQDLCDALIELHATAYGWYADRDRLILGLSARLRTLPLHDIRLTLKALVDELDQAHQQAWFGLRPASGRSSCKRNHPTGGRV